MSEADNSAPRNNPGIRHDRNDSHASDASSSEALATETRMRRALGLSPGVGSPTPQQRPEQARARHRFVQDGGVPVVMLNHKPDADSALRERIITLEAQLETERAAHATLRRIFSEQQTAYQALQTRLAHAELAHTEALESERRQRTAAQQALAELQANPAPNRRAKHAEPVIEPAPEAAPALQPVIAATSRKAPVAATAEKPKRGRPRIHPIPEPKPVRWWTPSFKTKSKA